MNFEFIIQGKKNLLKKYLCINFIIKKLGMNLEFLSLKSVGNALNKKNLFLIS